MTKKSQDKRDGRYAIQRDTRSNARNLIGGSSNAKPK